MEEPFWEVLQDERGGLIARRAFALGLHRLGG
jgi:hypothetical protein